MGNHTKGPWEVDTKQYNKIGSDNAIAIDAPNEGRDFVAYLRYDALTACIDKETTLANAQLIASAPDMLEALEELYAFASLAGEHIKIWSNRTNKNPELEEGLRKAIDKARAASKKAKGGNP